MSFTQILNLIHKAFIYKVQFAPSQDAGCKFTTVYRCTIGLLCNSYSNLTLVFTKAKLQNTKFNSGVLKQQLVTGHAQHSFRRALTMPTQELGMINNKLTI